MPYTWNLWPNHPQWAKTKSFSTKIRNKTRMSAFTTSIQHTIGSSSHSDQTRKRNKIYTNWQGGSKISLFADDMIVYIENPTESTKTILALISEFGKTAVYEVNIQKPKAFLYQQWNIKNLNQEKIPFDISTRKIKYLGINLTTEVVPRNLHNSEERHQGRHK